ncbi:uncharacterized protein LACBIDRAFT_334209 [Laccaria bicolor S238N-H82]|uniref:Predicted protein n=1 Tax=Laccaria bicolor (strain S238N-H82 / ATCC MYA-4686) TaxID=486041 RepID=B0DYG9_LACBS|nr:uncharacterized protein LACBIDRAFT_334209 [Laccaria bicolor S238N-H82]EDR00436.1 predicted protein [Laccaria bicolor S238N-H82]|eukprot:XP_001888995.1 predicted protein [Laccaria bicolor S238N-H82]
MLSSLSKLIRGHVAVCDVATIRQHDTTTTGHNHNRTTPLGTRTVPCHDATTSTHQHQQPPTKTSAHNTTTTKSAHPRTMPTAPHGPTTHEPPPTTTNAHECPQHDNECPRMPMHDNECPQAQRANDNAKTNETATQPHGCQYSTPPTTNDPERPHTEDSARVNGNGQRRAQTIQMNEDNSPVEQGDDGEEEDQLFNDKDHVH